MNEHEMIYDDLCSQRADIEAAVARMMKLGASYEDLKLLCWASGVVFEMIKAQESDNGTQ
jgi:hypothetical protein